VIVVIEDLHWAEQPLVELLERVVARSAGPLLLVVSARPELVERRAGWSTRLWSDGHRAPRRPAAPAHNERPTGDTRRDCSAREGAVV